MIRKRAYHILAIVILCSALQAQDYHFSQFMPNMVHMNPAYAAMPSSGELGLVYRNQWPGIAATFVTYGADVIIPVSSLNSGIGVSITNDVQGGGVITNTSASIMYGYLIELDRNWQVGAGLSASWVMKQFNADQLVFRSDLLNDLGYSYGPVTYGNYDKNYPDFSVGLIARNNQVIQFGVSASHITRPTDTQSQLNESRLPMKYTAFVSGSIGNNNRYADFSVQPGLFFSTQRNNHEIIWGSNLNIGSNFMVGGWLRHNARFAFDAFIISAGISWDKYNIGYSYDVNLKKLSALSTKLAAHEVTFLYRFKYKEQHKVKRFRKSECPAY